MTGPAVYKLGGRVLDDPPALDEFARALAAAGGRAVLVHGGGPEVSAWSAKLGLTPRFVDGRRVTDPATLEVATAVLAGLANKRLVARLLAHGVRALGLSALDGGLARVDPHPDAATLGAVGTVRSVDAAWLRSLLAEGFTPVIASIGAAHGELLNVNADDLAGTIATALAARQLVMLSDTDGVRLGGRTVAWMGPVELARALESPEVTDGMRPKLAAVRGAVGAGVHGAWIGKWNGPETLSEVARGKGPGTHVGSSHEPAEAAHE